MANSYERFQELALEVLGRKGVYAILRSLGAGVRRFGLLQQVSGLPPRTLSLRLKELESLGWIRRKQYAGTPPRVDYDLTSRGKTLKPLLEAVERWTRQTAR